jgi:ATPase subunit of ABC transporter with duplicated ATPase domains
VKLAYRPEPETLDPEKTVWRISGGQEQLDLEAASATRLCRQLNFLGADQQKKVGNLSGGERNRVHLAMMLTQGANAILLDEPTNDLDVNTLRALEEALEDFAGCAVVVSHDRWFLDRVATHILAFEGESQTRWFEGNWTDYEIDRRRRLGAGWMAHRIVSKLTRRISPNYEEARTRKPRFLASY